MDLPGDVHGSEFASFGRALLPWLGENINKKMIRGFPGGAVVENLPANAGDTGSSPGLGRSHMPWSD